MVVAAISYDGEAACQRAGAPSLYDMTEEPMLDLVPLRGARRVVTDGDAQAGFIGQLLEFELP